MTRQETIQSKISNALEPLHLSVMNESHMHAVPPGSESHFKLVVVAQGFEGKRLVQRHQVINALLAEELASGLHALSMETLTPAEWEAREGAVLQSPDCHGGGQG